MTLANRLLPALLATVLFTLPQAGCAQSPSWSAVDALIRSRFPEVEQISTDSLAAWMRSGRPEPVLLDARTAPEYAVSHLPGAVRVEPGTEQPALPPGLLRDAPIVVYCSVGYRSSELVERLRQAGFTNVANLQGSIFQWANEGRPVYRDGKAVREVHPYDRLWGGLLQEELRAYEPAQAARRH